MLPDAHPLLHERVVGAHSAGATNVVQGLLDYVLLDALRLGDVVIKYMGPGYVTTITYNPYHIYMYIYT